MLRELIEKLFKNKPDIPDKSEKNQGNGITRISDIVSMPSREEFLYDIEKQEKIDEYKKEYLKTLGLTRTITSVDIMPEELHDYQNIYLDLLMNLFEVEDSSEVSFDSPNDIIDEDLDLSIKCLKLRIYLEHVRELIIETKLRLIALNEILNEKKLSKAKGNAVLNELNNLQHSLFIFQNQEWSMIKAIHNNLIMIEGIDLKTFLENIDNPKIEETDETLINKRLEEVREMAIIVIPDIVGYLESLNLSPKVLIATLEQELEIYIYTHKDDLIKLRNEKGDLCFEIDSNTHFFEYLKFAASISYEKDIAEVIAHKKEYLSRIRKLELLYKMFSKYGRNLVTKEELKELYERKFRILTIDIFGDTYENPFKDLTKLEKETYENILFEKVESITKGTNSTLLMLSVALSGKNYRDISKIFMEFLKGGKNTISYSKLLGSEEKIALQFLLALDLDEGLTIFFDQVKDSLDYNINAFRDIFVWDSKLPLSTICKIIDWNVKLNLIKEKDLPLIYRLYKMLPTYKSDYYSLPEGLIKILFLKSFKQIKNSNDIVSLIREEAKNKCVRMPKSLKSFSEDLFGLEIKSIALNEGLKNLGDEALKKSNISSINIPSTLENFGYYSFDWQNLKSISFQNCCNSYLLNNPYSQIFSVIVEECFEYQYDCNVSQYKIKNLRVFPRIEQILFFDEHGELFFSLGKDDLEKIIKVALAKERDLLSVRIVLANILKETIMEKLALNQGTANEITRKN